MGLLWGLESAVAKYFCPQRVNQIEALCGINLSRSVIRSAFKASIDVQMVIELDHGGPFVWLAADRHWHQSSGESTGHQQIPSTTST